MMWIMPEMFQYRDRACCLLAFSNQYRYHTTCAILTNPGASSGEAGIWGKDPRGVPNALSVRTVATAMPNQTCVEAREPRPMPCANRPVGIAPNERDLADSEQRSGILCQALFRVDICSSQHLTRNAKTYHRENMFHRDGSQPGNAESQAGQGIRPSRQRLVIRCTCLHPHRRS
jgi:hypothetical protein